MISQQTWACCQRKFRTVFVFGGGSIARPDQQDDSAARTVRSGKGSPCQAFENLAQIKAAVEEVLDLAQIAIPLEAQGVVRAGQRSLDVAQGRVYSLERRVLGAGRTAAGGMRFVQAADAACNFEATQAIRDQSGRRRQGLLSKGLDGFLGEWRPGRAHEAGLAELRGLHRLHERNLVGRTAAGLGGPMGAVGQLMT